MIDYCTSKRIFSFILALIVFSVLIFFVEEYAESDELDTKFKKYSPDMDSKKQVAHSSNDCWLKEAFTVVQLCQPCSEFEISALKAKHCLPTGFYDRLNCSSSGIAALRPCTSKIKGSQSVFWWFFAFNLVAMVISSIIATKRKEFLNQNAYMRVSQQFE